MRQNVRLNESLLSADCQKAFHKSMYGNQYRTKKILRLGPNRSGNGSSISSNGFSSINGNFDYGDSGPKKCLRKSD